MHPAYFMHAPMTPVVQSFPGTHHRLLKYVCVCVCIQLNQIKTFIYIHIYEQCCFLACVFSIFNSSHDSVLFCAFTQ